jgi:outer membrane protein assembly factor BamB
MRRICLLLGAALFVAVPRPAHGDDWPQWRGPHRDGVSKETGLLKTWPKEGPKLVWKVSDIGNGYSTPSVVGTRIYVQSNRGDEEFALALDAATGKQVWSTRLGKVGPNKGPQYPGSRSTPTIEGDVLYALGSDGDLVCLECAGGKERWHKNLRSEEFEGKPGNWAYSESPLIDGDLLICTPGGAKATLAALDKKTGDVRWKSAVPGGDEAAYSSVIAGTVGKVKLYIQVLQKGVIGVAAKDGRFLWRYTETVQKSPANIPTPVFHDGYVFTSTGMAGAGLIKLEAEGNTVKANQLYRSESMKNNIGGVVLVGDYIYGTAGKRLRCLEFKTGTTKWEDACVGTAGVCCADGRLYLRSEDTGAVALVEATPDGYHEKGRFEQPDRSKAKDWPHPVVANGRLYLRDQNVLLCYDVKGDTK